MVHVLIHNFLPLTFTDESKLNSGSWEDPLPTCTTTSHNNNTNQTLALNSSGSPSANNGNTITTTTAQLHNITNPRRPDTLATGRNGVQPLLIQPPPAAASTITTTTGHHHHQHHLQHQHHHQQPQQSSHHSTHTASAINRRCGEAATQQQQQQLSTQSQSQHQQHQQLALQGAAVTGNTIAGGSFNANGGSTAVGVGGGSTSPNSVDHIGDTAAGDFQTISPIPPPLNSSSEDEELNNEEDINGSVTSSLSATNQRNSQLRSTFNRAKQHLSFDKWRSTNSQNSPADTSSNSSTGSSSGGGGTLTRRASTSCATMPTAHQPPREDITTPGESPGGRLSRWFSIRRGSSHQYDVGGRDGRHSNSSSIDMPDSTCDSTIGSPQKMNSNSANTSKSACKMPGVPEVSVVR